jgi:hypothetical protein
MLGYKYDTEQEAIDAREACDAYYGIPVNDTDITRNWTEYLTAIYNNPIFWYFMYDVSLVPILGQPTEFEVIEPPFPPTN